MMGDPRVSRMAAVLVMAAGGEIKVPFRLMRDKDLIELEQIDHRGRDYVTYRARYGGRHAPGAGKIIDAEFEDVPADPAISHEQGARLIGYEPE